MGWGEFYGIPNEYSDEIKRIDEKLLELIKQRKIAAGKKRMLPPSEIMEQWAERFSLEPVEISGLLQGLTSQSRRISIPNETGALVSVVPVLKKSVVEDCEYQITHIMNHERASVVHIEVQYLPEDGEPVSVLPALDLDVQGPEDYATRSYGSHGHGSRASLRFLVAPVLPEQLAGIRFALVPNFQRFDRKEKEIVLKQPVPFES